MSLLLLNVRDECVLAAQAADNKERQKNPEITIRRIEVVACIVHQGDDELN